jgi:hypothetical protein
MMKQVLIGRSAQADIVIDSEYKTVSAKHATVEWDGMQYKLHDHSANGTYVNGEKVHNDTCVVERGDVVTLSRKYMLDLDEVLTKLDGKGTAAAAAESVDDMIDDVAGVSPAASMGVPSNIDKFNWGAFLLGWIWGIGNSVWIGLICLIPYVGWIMAFVLGFKGNKWAWEAQKDEKTPAQFVESQRKWTIAGVVILVVGIIFYTISMAILGTSLYYLL